MAWPAIAAAGMSLLGSLGSGAGGAITQGNAADKASQQQTQMQLQAMALDQQRYEKARQLMQPYVNYGNMGLERMLGTGPMTSTMGGGAQHLARQQAPTLMERATSHLGEEGAQQIFGNLLGESGQVSPKDWMLGKRDNLTGKDEEKYGWQAMSNLRFGRDPGFQQPDRPWTAWQYGQGGNPTMQDESTWKARQDTKKKATFFDLPIFDIFNNNEKGNQPEMPWIEGRAWGGPIRSAQPYMVGEHGPEVIVPQREGTVIPNIQGNMLAGGQGMANAMLGMGGNTPQRSIGMPTQGPMMGGQQQFPMQPGMPQYQAPGGMPPPQQQQGNQNVLAGKKPGMQNLGSLAIAKAMGKNTSMPGGGSVGDWYKNKLRKRFNQINPEYEANRQQTETQNYGTYQGVGNNYISDMMGSPEYANDPTGSNMYTLDPGIQSFMDWEHMNNQPQTAPQQGILEQGPPELGAAPERQPFDFAAMQASPWYQQPLQQGIDAIQRSAIGKGGLYSGATGQALNQFGQDYGYGKYSQARQQHMGEQDSDFNRWMQGGQANLSHWLQGTLQPTQEMIRVGQNSAAGQANQALSNSQYQGNLLSNIGSSQASSTLGQGGAYSGMFNNMGNLLGGVGGGLLSSYIK